MEKIGIVGFPNVGKTFFFNLVTGAQKEVKPYPFTTIGKNTGKALLKDDFLEELKKVKGREIRPVKIDIIDIAGLIEGASKGEGLGNEFLGYIREAEILIFLLRGFKAPDVPSSLKEINPKKEYEILLSELFIADLQTMEKMEKKLEKDTSKQGKENLAFFRSVREKIEKGEKVETGLFPLLSTKPRIIVVNVNGGKNSLGYAKEFDEKIFLCPLKLLAEMSELETEEKEEFLQTLKTEGMVDTQDILWSAFKKLGYIVFYTVKGDIISAFPLRTGQNALDAASKVHTDFSKRFVKVEVANFRDYIKYRSWKTLKEKGLLKIEGKEYIVLDRDIIEFKLSA